MACISIATIANWHDYKASQLVGWWRTTTFRIEAGEKEDYHLRPPSNLSRPGKPVIRSAFISHKFDMIREEYDNGHQVGRNCPTIRATPSSPKPLDARAFTFDNRQITLFKRATRMLNAR